jgi:hypothetical protein
MSRPARPTLLELTRDNALDALARDDRAEFKRLSLDVAGLLGRHDSAKRLMEVRSELVKELRTGLVVSVSFAEAAS